MSRTEPDAAPHMERLVGVGVTWKLASQVTVQVIRLLTVAVLARLLTPHDYGAAAIAIAMASFAPTVADMGLGSALVQAEEAPQKVRSTAFWASVATGLGLFVICAALSEPIAAFMDDPGVAGMVVAGGLTFAIYSLGSSSQAVYMREMRFRSIELRTWLGLVTGSVVAIVAAAAGAGAWALALQQLAFMSTLVAALWFRSSWRPTATISRPVLRDLGSYALRIAGGRWARLIELLVLTVLIGKLASVDELGAWSFGMSMVILPLSLIAIPIAEVLFSAFSRMRNEPERIAALWLESVGYLAALLLPVLFGLMILAPDLVPAVFGAKWTVSVVVVQILSIYVLIRCLQSWGSVYMDAVGRPEVTFYTQLASLCLTPIAVVVGVHWGIAGVAACFVFCQMIAVEIPMFIITTRHMRVAPRVVFKRLSGIFVASVAMAAACLLARAALESAGIGTAERILAVIAIGIAVYLPALWWLAPSVSRKVFQIVRGRMTSILGRRRAVLQAEHG